MADNFAPHTRVPRSPRQFDGGGPIDAVGWYRIRLSSADLECDEGNYLKDSFQALYLAAGRPAGMGLYMEFCGGNAAVFYLTPLAAHYARELQDRYDTQPCSGLPHERVILICGEPADEAAERIEWPGWRQIGMRLRRLMQRIRIAPPLSG